MRDIGATPIQAQWSIVKRWLKIGFGVVFLILGILGLFLPVLQGILFIAVGVSLLAGEIPWIERRVDAVKARHPRAAHAIDGAEAWLGRQWRALGRRGRSALARLRGRGVPD